MSDKQHRDMTGWERIETAPKNGTKIQLSHEKCSHDYDTRGCWIDGSWETESGFIDRSGRLFFWTPTHWKPVPKEGEPSC